MEKIDIISILTRETPGLRLYDTLIEEDVIFEGFGMLNGSILVRCTRAEGSRDDWRFYNRYGDFIKDGYMRSSLVPSKDNRDWRNFRKFSSEDGDVLWADLKTIGPVLYMKRGNESEGKGIHFYVLYILNPKEELFNGELKITAKDCEEVRDIRQAMVDERLTFLTVLQRNGWYYDEQKKTVTFKGAPSRIFFSAFDKVLVRSGSEALWRPSFYGYRDIGGEKNPYVCMNGSRWEQCIPYRGNEKLIGTSDVPRILFLRKQNEKLETD